MSNPPRAALIRASASAISAGYGPSYEHYEYALAEGALYRWILGSTSTADGVVVLAASGGSAGRWVRVRAPAKGADLTDGTTSISIAGGAWRVLPAATLAANRSVTVATTNAAAGDVIRVTRRDVGAWTYALVNGGAGAGTMITMPASKRWWADVYFDGTDWSLQAAGEIV